MQLLNVTNLPIYLPFDQAPVPFGDPIEGVTCTAATPGVVTAPGYEPTNGDAVMLSFTAGGSMPGGLTEGTTYYVVSASGDTFELAATKGGSAIATTTTGADLVLHLLSGEVDGVALPFKPGNSAVCLNLSAGTLVLQGSADTNNVSGLPGGPASWQTIASVGAGAAALVDLSYDWIRVSTAGTLVLLQN
ncbi:MAG: hypothetical protein KGL39_09485 [Patescibacteria group bacterium]|nr:hypothetical protein [Patescibacteria group bacterium]